MLCALNKMASRQAKPTEDLLKDVDRFLQYAATNPNAQLTYRKSGMRLICHSDASYLSETGSRSRAGGFFYLGEDLTSHNHGIGSLSQIIENVVSSAAESEYAALFKNGQRCCIFQNILADIGYPQIETPIVTDNTTARGTALKSIKSKRLQTTALRHHWIRDRVSQGQFQIIWEAGESNRADFFTKALPVKIHYFLRTGYAFDSAPTPSCNTNHKKRRNSC